MKILIMVTLDCAFTRNIINLIIKIRKSPGGHSNRTQVRMREGGSHQNKYVCVRKEGCGGAISYYRLKQYNLFFFLHVNEANLIHYFTFVLLLMNVALTLASLSGPVSEAS